MRITGGRARGIPLTVPNRGGIRPATDYLREAVFSSLGPNRLHGARVLDCFAGTGAYGLEALSRGAAHATFIEQDRACQRRLRANLEAVSKSAGLGPNPPASIMTGDCLTTLRRLPEGSGFELIFVDPPYSLWEPQGPQLWETLAALIAPSGCLIAEAPGDHQPGLPPALTLIRRIAKGPKQPSALLVERG